MISDLDRNTKLGRKALAEALTSHGYIIAVATLATKACRGDGPPFVLWGRQPVYTWGAALDWASSRVRNPRRPQAEIQSRQAA